MRTNLAHFLEAILRVTAFRLSPFSQISSTTHSKPFNNAIAMYEGQFHHTDLKYMIKELEPDSQISFKSIYAPRVIASLLM